jgi:hypothetical protein
MIVSIIGLTLGAGATWHNRALAHLADARAASRLAESALTSLQSNQHPTNAPTVHYHQIAQASDFPGMTWVEVNATVNGRSASLIGLVPTQSLAGGGS